MKNLIIVTLAIAALPLFAQESYVQLPPNSTGVKLRMRCNTIATNLVCSQGFFLDDGSGSGALGVAANPIFVNFVASATTAITAASLPLPANAAKETGGNLDAIAGSVARIPSSPATDRTTAAAPSATRLSNGSSFITPTTPSDTQPISAASLPLPANAAQESGGHLAAIDTNTAAGATSANQTNGNAKTQLVNGANAAGVNASGQVAVQNAPNLDVALSTRASETTLAAVKSKTDNLDTTLSSRAADASVTETHAVAAAAVPSKVDVIGGSDYAGTPHVQAAKVDSSGNLYVILSNGTSALIGHVVVDSGSITITNSSFTVTQASGANLHVNVDSAPTTAVTNAGLSNLDAALSTRATESTLSSLNSKDFATSAKQDAQQTTLTAIATNTTGASTAANQATQLVSEQSIDSKVPSQKNGALPIVITQTIVATPPALTAAQLNNPLLYRAAMKQFCSMNLCPPTPLGK